MDKRAIGPRVLSPVTPVRRRAQCACHGSRAAGERGSPTGATRSRRSIVKSLKLYLADTGLLCALLNIRSQEALTLSPWAGVVWETFVFTQLRHRERRAGHVGSLFFWRDRTREVDFLVDLGGRLELFEAKWCRMVSGRRTSRNCRN